LLKITIIWIIIILRGNGGDDIMLNNKDKNTKKLLCESFKRQLLKRPFDKITIKMITDGAGVIRPTFYNYYRDKYEVFEYILDEELINVTYILIDNGMEIEAIKMIFTYFDNNRSFFHEAFKVEGQNSFEGILVTKISQLFQRIIQKHNVKIRESANILSTENIAKYYSIGIVYILKMWILSDKFEKITSDEMFNAYMFIITHSMFDIIEKPV